MDKKEIFISYSSQDKDQAHWVKSVLEGNGFSCWIDENSIRGGSDFAEEIPSAIDDCKIVVLILSQNSQNSKWVEKEIIQALNKRKIIMPFTIEKFDLNKEFIFYLSNVQRYEAYRDKEIMMRRMVTEISRILERPLPSGIEDVTEPVTPANLPVSKSKKPSKLAKLIKFLSPYGRKGASEEKVKFPLDVVTVLNCCAYIPLIMISLFETDMFIIIFPAFCISWYVCYGICLYIAKMENYTKTKALILAICSFFVMPVIFIFFITIAKFLSFSFMA